MSPTTTSKNDATMLGSDFTPGEKDVMVGRGKVCYRHSGNQQLAKLVKSVLETYSDPRVSKKGKTELIKEIVNKIRESSPQGGFVKFDEAAGCWYEVGDKLAREKVSQTFRDALTDTYKSSTTSKTLRRRQQRINRQSSIGSKESQESDQTSPNHSFKTLSSSFVPALPPLNLEHPSFGRTPSFGRSSSFGRRSSFGCTPLLASLPYKSYPYSSGLGGHNPALVGGHSPCLQLAVALADRRRTLENLVLANNASRR